MIPFKTRVSCIDSPSKYRLKIETSITPMNCPPKSKIPPAVASPTGKEVCIAKSAAVVSSGYAKMPASPPAT